MKILQVIPYYRVRSGGDVNVCFNISKELVNKGHSVSVVCWEDLADEFMLDSSAKHGISVIRIPSRESFGKFFHSAGLKRWLEDNVTHYDLVHFHTLRSAINNHVFDACREFSIPYVIHGHGSVATFFKKGLRKRFFDLRWGNKFVNQASALIALNEEERNNFHDVYGGPNRVTVIPNGVDLDLFKYTEAGKISPRYLSAEDSAIICYVGRIVEDKGIRRLIELMNFLENMNIVLLVVGPDGGYLAEMKELIGNYGLEKKVHYLGMVSENVKAQVLKDSLALVVPWYNGFPITFLEACASGTPIITTEKGDKLDWIHDNVGMVTEDSPQELAKSIVRLASDDELKNRLRDNTLKTSERFSWIKVIDDFIDLYESCIFNHQPLEK